VALDSADVWGRPELFQLDSDLKQTGVAGVPPDYFSAAGQRWGNPLRVGFFRVLLGPYAERPSAMAATRLLRFNRRSAAPCRPPGHAPGDGRFEHSGR
jgi:hypothetical protein